jgi:pSer/pThr/pTyr-binding forkhead associated (FHA) protein
MDRFGEAPVLIGQAGPLNGQRWAILSTLVLGRESDCDVVIPDRQVSRYHARLTLKSDGVQLEDMGSKNGVFVNSKKVEEPILLADGDLLQVAFAQDFVYLSSDSTVPLAEIQPVKHETARRLNLELRSRRVWVNLREVLPPLSMPQFRLLQALYDQQGKVVSRQDLILVVWGEDEAVAISEEALDALVRRLRDRLAEIDPDTNYITTIRGHGLRLDNPLK